MQYLRIIKMSKEKIETIFDHNLTKEEKELWNPNKLTIEEYIKKWNLDQNEAYEDIYSLYTDRRDNETAQKYYDKMSKESKARIDRRNAPIEDDYCGTLRPDA